MTTPAQLVRRYLDASAKQDQPAMLSMFSADFTYHVPGRSSLAGTTSGPSAALDYFAKLSELSSGTFTITGEDDLLESATSAVLINRESMARNGHSVEWRRVIWFTIANG